MLKKFGMPEAEKVANEFLGDWAGVVKIVHGNREVVAEALAATLVQVASQNVAAPIKGRVVDGDVELNTISHMVRVRGRVLPLTPKEYSLVKALIEAKGAVLSRESLLNDIWGSQDGRDSRTVDQHVARLRGKLRGASDKLVTVVCAGYRWNFDR